MIVPSFIYNSITFTPTYPPIGKQPVDELVATKTDSITSTGEKQSIVERIDQFQSLSFPVVPQSELANWVDLITWGMNGGVITYLADSSDSVSAGLDYYLENTDWNPKRVALQAFAFDIKLRRVIP